MDILFKELRFDNKIDVQNAIRLLNEFMNLNVKSEREIDENTFEKMKNLGFSKIYLCESDSNIIGIAVCFKGFSTYKQSELINIHDFYIQKDYQGKGIGMMFLDYIEKESIKNNFCRITLEVYGDNANAIKLYDKCGYIGSENSDSNCLIYAMKKDLRV